MRLTNGSTEDTKKYMVNGIRYVCENFKERAPGTHSERKAQKYLKSELEKWADKVETEDFEVHPAAFMGWIPVAGCMGILSVLFYWLTYTGVVTNSALAVISTIMVLLALACLVFEFLMYREFVDFLFPKKISRNVMARRAPAGEIKRRIIFGGHTDAANEWTYSLHGGLKSLAPVMGGSIGGLIFISIFDIVWLVYDIAVGSYESKFWLGMGIIQLVLVPFFIAICFFINWKVVVDGANDNLTADFIAMGVLKEMADHDMRFEHTEVCALLAGSEEAGLRGSLAYAKKHCNDLQDVETIFIAMDTMREVEQLQIYSQGCTGTQKNSNAVCELIYEAGANCGIEMKETEVYPGAIDAEAFSRCGLLAAGFCGVNHDPKTYYHTRLDTPDNMSEECINLSLDICLEAAALYDRSGGIDDFRAEGAKRFKRGHNN
ncbi:MAG: M28 family peptidase [Clostridiales bacterium]|nr:M28 family peptidase [Clostridiales bacterium]